MNEKTYKNAMLYFKLALICLLIYWGVNHLEIVNNLYKVIMSLLYPFLMGGLFALVLNIPMNFFEKN